MGFCRRIKDDEIMHQYLEHNTDLKSNVKLIKVNLKNKDYTFKVDNGVFSKKGLDFGTRTLLETIPLDKINGRVLDIGCGYGAIGIFVASNTDAVVDMTDINERSLALARQNVLVNHVQANVQYSNIYSNITDKYDYIITNPPIRVGKKILYEILFMSREHLTNNGEMWLVVSKDQGAKTLLRDLNEKYDAKLITKNKGFYIIRALNSLTK